MKATVILILLALPAASKLGWLAESNSARTSKRAMSEFQRKDFASAEKSFATSASLNESPLSLFNLGTAQVAAGRHQTGSRTLERSASADPALKADAVFNQGNAALSAGKLEEAIGRYESALRSNHQRPDAKRNLEIALQRKQKQDQDEKRKQQSKSGDQPQPNEQSKKSRPGDARPDRGKPAEGGQPDARSLLDAVEQQEKEELRRMRRFKAGPAKIGW